MAASRRGSAGESIGLGAALVVAAPVLVGIIYSVAASVGIVGPGASHVDVRRVMRVFADPVTSSGLAFTVTVSFVATVLATAIAVAVSVVFRSVGVVDRLGRTFAALSLPVPHIVAAALGVWVLGQSGWFARMAFRLGWITQPAQMPALVYDRHGLGLILVMAWKEAAFLSVVATALLATRTIVAEEAARTLGAGRWATFRWITWPLLWRGLMPAIVAVFIFVAGSYEGALLLAPSDPRALPLLVVERATDPDLARRGDAYVVTLILFALAIVAVVVHELARARWETVGE